MLILDKGTVYIMGNEYKQVEHFFTYPVDSKELGIYVVSKLVSKVFHVWKEPAKVCEITIRK